MAQLLEFQPAGLDPDVQFALRNNIRYVLQFDHVLQRFELSIYRIDAGALSLPPAEIHYDIESAFDSANAHAANH